MKGLLVSIYQRRDGSNCSNNGISSKFDRCILVGEGVPEIFEPSEDTPAVMLRKKSVFGKEYIYASPYHPEDPNNDKTWYMFGGQFVYTSDSRMPTKHPLPLHDRTETQEQYDRLSI